MIYSVIKENSYQDSINLMLLTNHINSLPNVEQCSIMMGTDANKDILKNTGMYHQDVDKAKPDDMVIVVKGEGEQLMEAVLMEVEDFLQDQSIKKKESGIQAVSYTHLPFLISISSAFSALSWISSRVKVGFSSAVTAIASPKVPERLGFRSAINALSRCMWLSTNPGIRTLPSPSISSFAFWGRFSWIALEELLHAKPRAVSYTHLDVYKRQRSPG